MLILVTVIATFFALKLSPIRFNVSNSMPKGVYWMVDKPLEKGDFVAVCLPKPLAMLALERGYVGSGNCAYGMQPLLKKVVAMEGDRVAISAKGITVNTDVLKNARQKTMDSKGRNMPVLLFNTVELKDNQVWLHSDVSPDGFDSRYLGVVDKKHIRSVVRPLFIFN